MLALFSAPTLSDSLRPVRTALEAIWVYLL
jgi:hypothetical protein